MAKALSITVVAEGVENNEIVLTLAAEGCDAYQGYYFSKPKTSSDICAFLRELTPLKLTRYSMFYDLGSELSTISDSTMEEEASYPDLALVH